jgi:hypothetical protein
MKVKTLASILVAGTLIMAGVNGWASDENNEYNERGYSQYSDDDDGGRYQARNEYKRSDDNDDKMSGHFDRKSDNDWNRKNDRDDFNKQDSDKPKIQ